MASLTDDPRLTGSIQSVKGDYHLLNKAARLARRKGDFGKALEYRSKAREMGLPELGKNVNDMEFEETGRSLYNRGLARGMRPQTGGLDGYDFRQRKDQGNDPGFMVDRQGSVDPGFERGEPQPAAPDAVSKLTSSFRQKWKSALTPGEADAIVAQAADAGVPLSEAGSAAVARYSAKGLQRTPKGRLLPLSAKRDYEFSGPVDPNAPAGPVDQPSNEPPADDNLLPPPVDTRTSQLRRQYAPAFAASESVQKEDAVRASPLGRLATAAGAFGRKFSDFPAQQRRMEVQQEEENAGARYAMDRYSEERRKRYLQNLNENNSQVQRRADIRRNFGDRARIVLGKLSDY